MVCEPNAYLQRKPHKGTEHLYNSFIQKTFALEALFSVGAIPARIGLLAFNETERNRNAITYFTLDCHLEKLLV